MGTLNRRSSGELTTFREVNIDDVSPPVGVVRMKREINLTYASAVMTGCIIGSGIFVSPTSIIHHSGSVGMALALWLAAGLLMIPVVLSYAELAIIFPNDGAEYVYYTQVLGPLPGFLVVWVFNVVILPAFYAVLTLTATNYMLFPFYTTCPPPSSLVTIISTLIMVTVVVLNSVYVRYVTRVQTFFTAVKVIALVIIIVTGFVQIAKGKTEVLNSGFENTTKDPGGIAVAIYSGIFTYGGWQYLFILLEEVKRPEKIVPQATLISMLSVIVLYLLTNVAYFTVMTPEEMMASPAVAVTFAERTLGQFSLVVPLLVACSTIGALNGSLLGGSRMAFAAARDGVFPDIVGTINVKYLTPWASLWFLCILSVVYIVTGEAVSLIEYLGFIAGLLFITSLWCVIYLRWKRPDLPRPIKIPLPITILLWIIMILLALLGLYKQPRENGIGVLFVVSGIPVYLIGVAWKKKPAYFRRFMYNFNILLQKAFMLSSQDKEE